MHFHSKMAWPPATYDIISRNHSNWPSLNLSQNGASDKQTATENFRCWCFIVKEKNQKNLRGDGSRTPPPPPLHVCPRVKICLVFLKHYRKTVFDPRQEKNFFFYINYREQSFNEKTFCKNNRTAPMLKSRKFHSWFWLHDSLFSRVCILIHLLRQKKIFAGINSKTWSFNKRMEISSAVERMVLRGGSKLGKNETYDADTLIIHDTACAHIFISTAFYTL